MKEKTDFEHQCETIVKTMKPWDGKMSSLNPASMSDDAKAAMHKRAIPAGRGNSTVVVTVGGNN